MTPDVPSAATRRRQAEGDRPTRSASARLLILPSRESSRNILRSMSSNPAISCNHTAQSPHFAISGGTSRGNHCAMTLDLLLALSAFALVTVITPGPNNLMLLASGANFGLRRSVPHMMGIGLGFPLMVLLVGLGVMQVFERWPAVRTVLLAVSAVYML